MSGLSDDDWRGIVAILMVAGVGSAAWLTLIIRAFARGIGEGSAVADPDYMRVLLSVFSTVLGAASTYIGGMLVRPDHRDEAKPPPKPETAVRPDADR